MLGAACESSVAVEPRAMATSRAMLRFASAAVAALVLLGCGGSGGGSGTCDDTQLACGGECVSILDDADHCGGCSVACGGDEACVLGACEAAPDCSVGDQVACYTGAAGTEGVGACTGGIASCLTDGRWSACNGQVVPGPEVCGNDLDEDCSGILDDGDDEDGDGFTACDGDCCDSDDEGCLTPELVNPGAFDDAGNTLDDDCDGTVDNVVAADCDVVLASDSGAAMDYARAIDICRVATEQPGDGRWGVISAKLTRASGTGFVDVDQRSIRDTFGATAHRAGARMAVLSTGNAAASAQTQPAFAAFQGGRSHTTTSAMPADWLALNSNNLPNAPGCPEPEGGTVAHDPVMLELRIRTPSNARSFRLSTNFFSSEYPEFVCSAFNDFFVVLLDSTWSGTPANPTDKNLAIYNAPAGAVYPVGVNLAHGDTGLFQVCENGVTGCATASGAVAGTITTCAGVGELANTGMDTPNPGPQYAGDPGYCTTNNLTGGATGWLVTQGNVDGGEIITLRIAVWDTSDGYYDSVALVDGFEWSVDASEPGTVIDVE